MGSKMLIDASQREETRIVVARGSRIEEFDFESLARKPLKGNIYLAKVTRVEPSLQAAFVDYGGNRHGFLAFAEIHPDYYQIPIADRIALLKEQEEEDAEDDDDHGDNGHQNNHRNQQNGDQNGNQDQEDNGHEHHDAAQDHDAGDNEPQSMAMEQDPVPAIGSDVVEHQDQYEAETEAAPTASTNTELEAIEEDAETRRVDSVGAEDAMEEVPQRRERRQPRRRYKIQEVIKRRQILLVQVVKEERGNKGAALTTYLSLAGRYCVLMPNTARGGGISRKITDAGDRRRLKEVARDVEVPQGMGLIVRTAGAQRTRPEIKRDFDYLMRLWESVRDLTLKSQAPCLVYEEGNLIKRSIRDLYTKDVDEIIVEGDEAYREAKDFMKMLMPSHAKNVKLYNENKPLFAKHQVEHHLDQLFSPTVTLPSGGYLVINQTEALVSIDINSGKATREHSIEDTAVKTNLEACDEIGRQLRLRDLAGLVVIDYIDMEENRNNRAVERRIKEALKNDRARIQVGRISHFGLLEMSRQRLRPGLIEGTFRTCPHCEGRGMIRSISSCGLGVLRSIEDHLMKRAENLTVTCAPEVASYLLNDKRDSLLILEQTYTVTVFIVPGHHDLKGMQTTIERAPDRELAPRRAVVNAPVRMDSAFSNEDDEPIAEEEDNTEAPDDDTLEDQGEARSADGEQRDGERADGGRKRRRRGRRGGRRGERNDEGKSEMQSDASSDDNGPAVENETDEATDDDTSSEVSEAGANAETTDDSQPRRDGNRRDRFGRNRNRNRRERGPRNDNPRSDAPRNDRGDRPPRDDQPEQAAAAKPDGEGEAVASQPSERPDRGDRPDRGPRRDRGGDRGGRNRGDRGDRGPRPDRPEREAFVPVAREPSPPIIIPDVIPDPEPRKWQPPAPTIQAAPEAKKGGWWSKRK
jgi:ribonuclease E